MTTSTTVRKSYGNRNRQQLYSFPEDYPLRLGRQKGAAGSHGTPKRSEEVAKLLKYIDDNVVGKNNAFLGPFGRRKIVFCDYAASGRSLQFIEEYILREVLPCYGSTHSTTNITSLQSTLFRQEAHDIIKNSVNATDEDAVIFAGHGSTGALKKLLEALGCRDPPVVFTGPSENHDNLQLWREAGAKVLVIAETKEGFLDLNDLEQQLRSHHNSGRTLIGCFSAASNVTGILADDIASTLLLHQYGALAFWDYTVAAPYVTVDMNPLVPGVEENTVYKDAVYFSGHKFVGGVQTPGILIAKKALFRHTTACDTDVFFTPHELQKSFEVREEGTAVAVIELIRAGLVVQLKETVTPLNILQRQEKITKQMLQHIRTIPEIILLGNNSSMLKRIPIFSFMVRHPRGTFLHHNFVCAVLNDMFGIQARSGCPCSGNYAQDLLGIDQSLADQYENIILEDRRLSSLNLCMENSTLELLRPGFTRISLPYFINDSELAFVMEAVKMVATEGWKLLPQYVVDLDSGEWRHHTNAVSKDRKWLSSIRYIDGKMTMNERRISGPGLFPQSHSECLQTARNLFNRARKTANRNPYSDQGIIFDGRGEKLRWFMLQHEAQSILTSNSQNIKHNVPFDPVFYAGSKRGEKPQDHQHSKCDKTASIKANISNNGGGSPRHFSLPFIDDPRILQSSSPVPYFVHDFNTLYCPSHHQYNSQTAPVAFAVGETVNSANLSPHLHHSLFRERCLSLGAPNVSPPILSPQTRASLGINNANSNNNLRHRNYSYSSELQSLESSDANLSPTHSLNILSASNFDCSQVGRSSPAPDLQTYVTEMTKELATNIKSEIREVISKVEDVLESTDSVAEVGGMSFPAAAERVGSEDGRSDSISANEVAEYLEKVSIEMANEVKSEIRDVVSAVDVFITPDNTANDKYSYSRTSSSGDSDACCSARNVTSGEKYTPGSSSETVIHLINKSTCAGVYSDEESATLEGKQCTNNCKILPSTVTSVSSQDSGINLSFHEHDYLSCGGGGSDFLSKRRFSTDSATNRPEGGGDANKRLLTQKREHFAAPESKSSDGEEADGWEQEKSVSPQPEKSPTIKWECPPKAVWQSTKDAIQEFDMIRNGDKVLVCLSGGKDSMSLLHVLLQYQSYIQSKGVFFDLGAITMENSDSCCGGNSSDVLAPYLKELAMHYIVEDLKTVQGNPAVLQGGASGTKFENIYSFSCSSLRKRIYATAKNCGYNVIAVGQHLDDVCESFLLSIFHGGTLRAMKAHYCLKKHDLRVIRPFVNVRERSLRQFATSNSLPVISSLLGQEPTKERQRAKQLLAQQEILFPKIFHNLRSALRLLVGFDEVNKRQQRRPKSGDGGGKDSSENDSDEEEPILLYKESD